MYEISSLPLCRNWLERQPTVRGILDLNPERLFSSAARHSLSNDAAIKLLASHHGETGSISGRFTPEFRTWVSCRMMLLVGGFSRGSPISTPFTSGTAPYSPRCPNLFGQIPISDRDDDSDSCRAAGLISTIYSSIPVYNSATECSKTDFKHSSCGMK
ncbi:hypothetical protein PR048_014842 [Dryococelus australis]|uniref:Uncharacterized protein n=1 Tax=Dryococelus australis TaxID=614101 RepID=A0ABQ9HFA8_9NEOP|nr:hypothetical protein PR048_014842 [Dryococelus australis]